MSTNPQFTISLTFVGNGTIRAVIIKPDGMVTSMVMGEGLIDDLDRVVNIIKQSLKSHKEDGIY